MTEPIEVICFRCKKRPDELEEYIEAASYEDMSPDAYVRSEEGTFNPHNGHFCCTDCYVAIGAPSSQSGWVAP